MIVDDELIVRVGIKSIVEWEANGFQIVGEAVDGEDALGKIPVLMPHIILTDIKMPRMDGIQLIQKVRERYREINIIVLSCHNDFEFVKEAMKLGATDYILKLSMDPDGLLKVMNNLKKQFDESSQQTSMIDFLRDKIDSNMDAIKEKFFRKVLSGGFLSEQSLFKEAAELNIRFKEGVYVILATQIKKNKGDLEKQTKMDFLRYSVLNIMEEAVTRELYGEVFPDGNDRFITILDFDKCVGNFAQVSPMVERYAGHLHDMFQTYLNIAASSGVYDDIINDTGSMNSGYKAACSACGHGFYLGNKKIIMYGELKYTGDIHEYFSNTLQKEILKKLEVGRGEEVKALLSVQFEKLMYMKDISPDKIKKACKQIADNFSQAAGELNIKRGINKSVDFYARSSEIDEIDNFFELKEWFDDCIEEYMGWYLNIEKGAYSEEIRKLKQYINENYDKEISLENAAGFLNVGKNYFCAIFKKETGETFFDYLINVRIDKAKELLRTTSLKNYEISEKVGYANFNYFSRLFKKIVGISPNEYRRLY